MTKSFPNILCLVLFLALSLTARASDAFVLVIDAGHGGHDAGSVGSFSKEKDINLSVALAFGKLVEQNCKHVKVLYTRKTDVFVTLEGRARVANKAKADLFISVHTNALPEGRIAYGSETYTLGMHRAASNLDVAKRENSVITYESDYKTQYEGFDPNKAESYVIFEFMQDKFMKQSVDLARCIQQHYVRAGRRDKGVHQAGFLVLRQTSMPAVLTELGFITTPEEERFLNSADGVRTMAASLYNGFLDYLRQHGARNVPKALTLQPTAEGTPAAADTADADAAEAVVEPVPYTLAQARPQPAREKPAAKATPAKATPAAKSAPAANATPAKAAPAVKEKPVAKATPAKAAPAKQATAKEKTGKTANPAEKTDKGTVYRIQFAASSVPINPKDKRYSRMPALVSEKSGNLYRHLTGLYRTRAEARAALTGVQKDYPGAFIVTYIDGKRQ